MALGGLIGTGISTYFAIKAVIEKNKGKSLADIWKLVMSMADDAMKAAEASGKKGEDKRKWLLMPLTQQPLQQALISHHLLGNLVLILTKQLLLSMI